MKDIKSSIYLITVITAINRDSDHESFGMCDCQCSLSQGMFHVRKGAHPGGRGECCRAERPSPSPRNL